MPLVKKIKRRYTYSDYLKWDESVRVELINGEMYDMTPAPSRRHQAISMSLSYIFSGFLKGKKCQVYAAPFDVRLPDDTESDDGIYTVVQPDISVICDPKKLDDRGCVGAPDMLIEILSKATAAKDMKIKLDLYEKHGVKEYWLIHPDEETVMVFNLGTDGAYKRPDVYSKNDTVTVKSLRGLKINLGEIFLL